MKLPKDKRKEMKSKIDDTLSEAGLKLKKSPVAMIKFSKTIGELMRSLCPDCLKLAMENPKRPETDYCPICKEKIKPILNEMMRCLE